MLKFIFQRLTDPLGLPLAWYWEWLILVIISAIAFGLAYNVVGAMYEEDMIDGKGCGSAFHWIIRLLVFVIIWAVTYGIIWLVKWICINWVLVLSILGGIVLVAGIMGILLLRRRKNKVTGWRRMESNHAENEGQRD